MTTKHIDGWLHDSVMDYVKQIDEIQKELKVKGNIAEIGVHHGKFFIPLAQLNKEGINIAADLFENQEENISQSGKGDSNAFFKNCKDFEIKNVLSIKENSLNLTAEDFVINQEQIRIFSVDGGHFTKEVLNDLDIAIHSLALGGVIIVDDFQHPGWDDVFSATLKYLFDNKSVVPFLMGGNKLFLVGSTYLEYYQNLKGTLTWEDYKKTVIMSSEARQLLKVQTLYGMFPNVQLFPENQW